MTEIEKAYIAGIIDGGEVLCFKNFMLMNILLLVFQ